MYCTLLMDAPRYETVQQQLMNARDVHGWATAVRELDPTLGNANSAAKRRSVAESTLNAYAEEWKATQRMCLMVNFRDKKQW